MYAKIFPVISEGEIFFSPTIYVHYINAIWKDRADYVELNRHNRFEDCLAI